jgi:hypothetical protein
MTAAPGQRGVLVRELAAVTHVDPDGRTVRITRWTLDRWITEWGRVASMGTVRLADGVGGSAG